MVVGQDLGYSHSPEIPLVTGGDVDPGTNALGISSIQEVLSEAATTLHSNMCWLGG